MKVADIRKKSDKDLVKLSQKLKDELSTLSREKYLTEEKNAYKSRNLRKDLARVLTVINENEGNETEKSDKEDKDTK